MSYQNLLSHKCDIYHLKEVTTQGKYGVPGETSYEYAATPDVFGEACYFYRDKAFSIQMEPHKQVNETLKVHFSARSSIQHNDKVVYNGIAYIIDNPMSIRGHHIEATAERVKV